MKINKRLMRAFWFIPIIFIGTGILLTMAITGLWNWIMPSVFGLGVISFWQTLGLLILFRLIFGVFRRPRFFHWGLRPHYARVHCSHYQKNCHNIPADKVQ